MRYILLALVLASIYTHAHADVLCKKPNGKVFIRPQCAGKETPIDPTSLGIPQCAPDAAKVGQVCVDKYEASVWNIPATNTALLGKVKQGTATLADLTGGGAIQYGVGVPLPVQETGKYPCSEDGNDCENIYAVSISGVKPSVSATWFQAQQACGNVGKRLLSNAEWQMAVAGTPDPGTDNGSTDCNILFEDFEHDPVNTGSHSACVSRWGVFDMVGNVWEWVADWAVLPDASCPGWGSFSDDLMCLARAYRDVTGPGALIRGGSYWNNNTDSGGFAIQAPNSPSHVSPFAGFRCGR
jgi:sulfatase-modifying factor enzyme 1